MKKEDMAELHHGELTYERKDEDTSVFKVVLPMDSDGLSAVDGILKLKPEVVFCDVMMPDIVSIASKRLIEGCSVNSESE